jgi:DNA adenine methylase
MPPHITYAEPFFGGGSVLLEKDPEGINEIVNDINLVLMRFWHIMRTPELFEMFVRKVQATPFGPWVWEVTSLNIQKVSEELFFNGVPSYSKMIQYMVANFILWRQSLAGRGDAPAPLSTSRTRRGMNEQVSAWLTCVEGLPAVHARMIRVALCCEDFEKFIERADTHGTLFYCDPPYLHETRAAKKTYLFEMSEADHERLLQVLTSIKGKFILSGYPSKLYDKNAKQSGWVVRSFDLPNNAAGGKEKRRMKETLWMNFIPATKAS